ncbi:hypothetical protein CHUAL_012824 [Chamberlinius hualienensis]
MDEGMDYMVFDVDRDDVTDDECVYECDFDVNEVLESTLKKLDVGAQVQDAIDTTKNMLNIVAQRYQYTSLVYAGLEADLKVLGSTMNALNSSLNASIRAQTAFSKQPSIMSRPFKMPVSDVPMDESPVAVGITRHSNFVPPNGPLIKKDLAIGNYVYALKGNNANCPYYKAKIFDIKFLQTGEKQYKVKYDAKKVYGVLNGKCVAYHDPVDVMLPVGTRIIAQYRDEMWSQNSLMYSGIIAEPPKMMNGYRYLVFFDDGYAQYVYPSEIRVMCESSKDVSLDIPIESREFIKTYLIQYPERPMVKLQKGHTVKTEWNGRWWIAKVVELDASLVKMYFHADKRTEWIYRGSTRLAPLYSELANAEAIRLSGKGSRRHNLSLLDKRSAPYVEYTRGCDDPSNSNNHASASGETQVEEKRQVARKHTLPMKQNVARKSTTAPASSKLHLSNQSTLPENEGEIRTTYFTSQITTKDYIPHECSPECLKDINDNPADHRGRNPLTIPLRFGWQRISSKHKSVLKPHVFYRAPCGRRLRFMEEINYYLKLTNSLLSIDLFCTDSVVSVFGEFVATTVLSFIKDVASGKELVQVSGVNSLNREYPDYLEYSTQRIPNKGVNLNLDKEFLVGCDCEDDCSDPEKCSCQQLTVEASKAIPGGRFKTRPGYVHRRLKEPVITGIYECNPRCKCNSRCLNRVVQNGLQLRLQIFKTEKRGWGIRCLDDIPQGGFICIYAGQLLTEQGANEDGTQFGDEYLAELDYIEVVEKQKEDYESDVVESDTEENEKSQKTQSGSEDEAGKDDSEDYKTDNDKIEDTSDSDFETGVASVGPRTQQTRGMEKLQKLIIRREPSDADNSNNSWNVRQSGGRSPSSDISSRDADDIGNPPSVPESTKSKIIENDSELQEMVIISSSSSTTSESSKDKRERSKRMAAKSKKNDKQSEKMEVDEMQEDNGDGKNSKDSKFRSFSDPMGREDSGRTKFKPTRSYFGDEFCYIMDAKSIGNIGRYLNHNCAPNIFVQNVFVDTHDLRFPWVAFFSLQHIRAGSELTWDYNYEVGSVPNKVLYCYCSAAECRGRLL